MPTWRRAADGHATWKIAASRRLIDVWIQRDVEMVFLEGLNVGTQHVQAESSARHGVYLLIQSCRFGSVCFMFRDS
jgi:hypothetical protein